jgi:hypothetical protein
MNYLFYSLSDLSSIEGNIMGSFNFFIISGLWGWTRYREDFNALFRAVLSALGKITGLTVDGSMDG